MLATAESKIPGTGTGLLGLAERATLSGGHLEHGLDEHGHFRLRAGIRMPGMDGLAATEIVRTRDHSPEVIVLTTFDADDHVLSALRAGASGFLLKDTSPADIVRAIRAVAAGEPILSPTITRRLIEHATGSQGGERRRHAANSSTSSPNASARSLSPSDTASPTPKSAANST